MILRETFSFGRDLVGQVRKRTFEMIGEIRADRTLRNVVLAMLLIDAAWTLWYGGTKLLDVLEINESLYKMRQFRITTDGGWPELYSYAKTFVLVALLFRLASSLRQPVYVALTVVFGTILLDDSLGIHESWGGFFVQLLGLQPTAGLRAQDIGELITWAILAAVLVPLLAISFFRSAPRHRVDALVLQLPFAGLVFSAVVVDQLYHVYRKFSADSAMLIDMIEDGGEMVAITLLVGLVAVLVKAGGGTVFRLPSLAGSGTAADVETGGATAGAGKMFLVLASLAFGALGCLAMLYLAAFDLSSPSRYPVDLTQAPHWLQYSGGEFPADDLLVHYAEFTEPMLHDAVYRIGTRFLDIIPLNRLVGVGLFGLTAALFFLLVARSSGARTGALAACLFLVFPYSGFAIAGGASRAWGPGLALLGVYVVERRAWGLLTVAMPLAALTYPPACVLLGATGLVGLLLELFRSRSGVGRGFLLLATGSVLAAVPLAYKHLAFSPRIGRAISTERARELWDPAILQGFGPDLMESLEQMAPAGFLVGLVVTVVLSLAMWRGVVWKRSWTALALALPLCSLLVSVLDRWIAEPTPVLLAGVGVLVVLGLAHNWSRMLCAVDYPLLRRGLACLLVFGAAVAFGHTFRPGNGRSYLQRWEDKSRYVTIARLLRREPSPVLLAGHPYTVGHVMVQSRRPALVSERMFEYRFDRYPGEMNRRVVDTFQAIYARDVPTVNRLSSEHGVTHLVIRKDGFRGSAMRFGSVWVPEFKPVITPMTRRGGALVLHPPPRDALIYEDDSMWLIRLPLR